MSRFDILRLDGSEGRRRREFVVLGGSALGLGDLGGAEGESLLGAFGCGAA